MEFEPMIRTGVFGLFLCLSVSSCDKAKDIAVKAKDVVSEQIERVSTGGGGSGKVTEELKALVDHAEDGYVFRKDLAFPEKVTVKETARCRVDARVFQTSLLGKSNARLDGVVQSKAEIKREGPRVSVELRRRPLAAVPKDGEKESEEDADDFSKTPAVKFDAELRGGKWNPVGFSGKNGLDVEQRLMDCGSLPRPFWFGKGRMKPGDQITLSGEHLKMLLLEKNSGSVGLTFEKVEPVAGHPCGVFAIVGDVKRDGLGLIEEWNGKSDVTIESGKLWVSLLYPVVLKEECKLILSAKGGDGDSVASVMQGSVEYTIDRQWSADK